MDSTITKQSSELMNMPTADQALDEVLNLAAKHFKVPREKLSPDDDFFKTLGIDSLQTLDLLTKLEDHFRVELPDYELQGVTDFRTLASKIQARL
jgi:acyl carrier protein